MNQIDLLLAQVEQLDTAGLKRVAQKLYQLLKGEVRNESINSIAVSACRKCNCEQIVKFGTDQTGKQRYRCKGCGATFTAVSFSVVSSTHKDADTWEKYIQLLLEGASLAKCAEVCHISVRTAFVWRHKILNALQKDQVHRVLGGIIEIDEMFVSVSYKGNHKKSKRFEMPRKSYKRGSDNHHHKSPQACIMCAVERGGQVYSEMIGVGRPDVRMISRAFSSRLAQESIVLSDKAASTKSYFKTVPYAELIQLRSHVGSNENTHKAEVKGAYHIQNVNNFHKRLGFFLQRYNGVATKYLDHYLSLFVWIENLRKAGTESLQCQTKAYVIRTNTYAKADELVARPPVPYAA